MTTTSIRIALASVLVAAFGVACTVTTSSDGNGGTGGSAGTGGTAGSGGTAGTGGTGGTGGADDAGVDSPVTTDASVCDLPDGSSACDTCFYGACCAEITACLADTDCATAATAFGDCSAQPDASVSDCASTFVTSAGAGASLATDVVNCVTANCQVECAL